MAIVAAFLHFARAAVFPCFMTKKKRKTMKTQTMFRAAMALVALVAVFALSTSSVRADYPGAWHVHVGRGGVQLHNGNHNHGYHNHSYRPNPNYRYNQPGQRYVQRYIPPVTIYPRTPANRYVPPVTRYVPPVYSYPNNYVPYQNPYTQPYGVPTYPNTDAVSTQEFRRFEREVLGQLRELKDQQQRTNRDQQSLEREIDEIQRLLR